MLLVNICNLDFVYFILVYLNSLFQNLMSQLSY